MAVSSKAEVSFPARCAVAVICGDQLISQVYPAAVPIEAFLDDIIDLLDEELRRRGLAGLDPNTSYELHKANGVRLDATRTLDEHGVEDGDTLVLQVAEQGDSFEPQCESLSTALARAGEKLFEPVSADTAAHTALVILAAVYLAVTGMAVHTRLATDALFPGVITGCIGVAAAGAATAAWRWWPRRGDMLTGFAWLAMPPLAISIAAFAPGRVGAAHLFIVALAAALLTLGIAVATKRLVGVAATIITVCALGGAVAMARMWRAMPAQWLGMCTLVGLLLLLTMAPTIALWAARIRPPHFGSITGRDLFYRRDGMPADAVEPVRDESIDRDVDEAAGLDAAGLDEVSGDNPDSTPPGGRVALAAVRANDVLTGICAGAGLALPAAIWATLMPGQERSTAAAVLAGLFVVIYLSRGRAYGDKRQAIALVCGAVAAVCVGAVKYVLHEPAASVSALAGGALVLIGFGAAAMLAGLLVPVTRFTPLVRMAAEWLELAAIVAALPLAAWIGGLFTWVRMR